MFLNKLEHAEKMCYESALVSAKKCPELTLRKFLLKDTVVILKFSSNFGSFQLRIPWKFWIFEEIQNFIFKKPYNDCVLSYNNFWQNQNDCGILNWKNPEFSQNSKMTMLSLIEKFLEKI